MKRIFRNFWRYFRREHIGDPIDPFKVIGTVGTFVGFVGLGFGATGLVREISTAWPGSKEFALYLYISYFTTVFGVAALLLFSRQLWHNVHDSEEQRALLAKIHHRLVEVVRRHAAIAKDGKATPLLLRQDTQLHEVLQSVRAFIKLKLNRDDVAIAVKYLSAGSEKREITAVVRDPEPDNTSARPTNSMPADQSVVYKHFIDGNRQMQRLLIRDVEKLDTDQVAGVELAKLHANYREYAKQCKFRSILAFPLRAPRPVGGSEMGLAASSILGFLSFDCPDPDAFDQLFSRSGGPDTNDGRNLKDGPDLQFFFALADTFATLSVLGAQ